MGGQKQQDGGTTVRVGIELALEPSAAFEAVLSELADALGRAGIIFEPGPGGTLSEAGVEIGRVTVWEPGERAVLRWRGADWQADEETDVELRFERKQDATVAVVEHRGWGRLVGDGDDLAGWFAGQVGAPLLRACAPKALGDWVTDRRARRPSGARGREVYGDPLFHYPNFRVILGELALTPADYLLEIGCGGGAMLRRALESGCRAAAVDHSPQMVRLAREQNRAAVVEGRLDVRQADAAELPFADATFTCAAMTGVFGFLPDPVAALREVWRVLRPGGRIVVQGSDAALKGTPAAPEPIASRLNFYSDQELEGLAAAAGFDGARVVRRDLLPYAREAGIPEPVLPLFAGGAGFLLGTKGRGRDAGAASERNGHG